MEYLISEDGILLRQDLKAWIFEAFDPRTGKWGSHVAMKLDFSMDSRPISSREAQRIIKERSSKPFIPPTYYLTKDGRLFIDMKPYKDVLVLNVGTGLWDLSVLLEEIIAHSRKLDDASAQKMISHISDSVESKQLYTVECMDWFDGQPYATEKYSNYAEAKKAALMKIKELREQMKKSGGNITDRVFIDHPDGKTEEIGASKENNKVSTTD